MASNLRILCCVFDLKRFIGRFPLNFGPKVFFFFLFCRLFIVVILTYEGKKLWNAIELCAFCQTLALNL